MACQSDGLDAPVALGARLPLEVHATARGVAAPKIMLETVRQEVLAVEGRELVGKAPGWSSVMMMTEDGIVLDFVTMAVEKADRLALYRLTTQGALDASPLGGDPEFTPRTTAPPGAVAEYFENRDNGGRTIRVTEGVAFAMECEDEKNRPCSFDGTTVDDATIATVHRAYGDIQQKLVVGSTASQASIERGPSSWSRESASAPRRSPSVPATAPSRFTSKSSLRRADTIARCATMA